MSCILKVAIPLPLYGLFDYRLPRDLSSRSIGPGMRIRVPFGRGSKVGLVMDLANETNIDEAQLKSAGGLMDGEVVLLAERDLRLLRWAADYYQYPLGEVVCNALPVNLRKSRAISEAGIPGIQVTDSAPGYQDKALKRSPKQAEILMQLAQAGGQISRQALRQQLGDCGASLRAMGGRGWIVDCSMDASIPLKEPEAGPDLTEEQALAVDAVNADAGQFQVSLLDGVTGSGKTEVYLSLARHAMTRGRQVLVLVPEIGLTPQLIQRFEERLGEPLALLHSGLTDLERELNWHAARTGKARVVIGTRSAVFTPMPELGLIIIDEEHDASFKQQDGLRYSARDVSIMRAKQLDCPILLGSATPSLETLGNVQAGRYQLLRLTKRTAGSLPPRLDLVDIRDQPMQAGLSSVLLREIETTLSSGQQALIFLNRRGFAPVLTCYACGWVSDCPRCDARQTLHAGNNLLWCHHCGSQRPAPRTCPDCDAPKLHPLGQGTERLEQELGDRFPTYPLIRIDRDATRRKGSLDQKLGQAQKADAAILIGTQMLAKGHHLPKVTLVGILDADSGLFSADFRAPERMAQLITQVAGRAGREQLPGRVLIQTRYPDHPLLQTLVRQGYPAFARVGLRERLESELPPYSFQALLRAEAVKSEQTTLFLEQAARLAHAMAPPEVTIWGPVPAPMERRAGRYRSHLLFQATERRFLQGFLRQVMVQVRTLPSARKVRWSLDVDPMDLY